MHWVTAASARITPPRGAFVPTASAKDGSGPHYPDFADCYGCGPDHPSGLQIRTLGPAGPNAIAEFTVRAEHQGAAGLAHGGVLAVAMDEAIGIAVWSLSGAYVTARLEVDYLLPVPVGATLRIRTRCIGAHRRKVYAEAEALLGGADGPIAVRAAALYVEVPSTEFRTDRANWPSHPD